MTNETRGKRPPERKELDRLLDVQDAIGNIQSHPRFGEAPNRLAWDQDQYFRGYCERQLGIIGEAASRLSADFDYENKHPDVPWRQIKALRNILVHMYWGSDPEILWGIIEKHVPDLKEKVDKWIIEKENDLSNKPQPEKKETKRKSKLYRRIQEMAESYTIGRTE